MSQDPNRRELDDLRHSIDAVDDAILDALERRALLSKKVRALREREGAEALRPSPKEERETLARIEQKGAGEFPKRSLGPIFREILSGARALEVPLRVAYEGPMGSVAHEAARKRFGASADYMPCEGTRATLQLVEREHADVGVLVIESAKEGLLQPTLDAIVDADLSIVEELDTDARIHLLNVTGNLQGIEKVYAAPAERAACAHFLAQNLPRAKVLDTRTPVMAAELAGEDHGAAALGNAALAEMFGLTVARGNVADATGEHLRCAVMSNRPSTRSGRDATALVVTIDDAPGALFRVLEPLAKKDLNLRRIQSRPRALGSAGAGQTYRFFLEVAGHVTDRPLVTAFEELKRMVRELKILGSYPSKS